MGANMRKLVLILMALIAVVTFIRAFDNSARISSEDLHTYSPPRLYPADAFITPAP
jgi:hypothetical protein